MSRKRSRSPTNEKVMSQGGARDNKSRDSVVSSSHNRDYRSPRDREYHQSSRDRSGHSESIKRVSLRYNVKPPRYALNVWVYFSFNSYMAINLQILRCRAEKLAVLPFWVWFEEFWHFIAGSIFEFFIFSVFRQKWMDLMDCTEIITIILDSYQWN